MGELFSNWLTQVLATVGCIYVFGLIVGFLGKIFYSGAGGAGYKLCVATGLIGTPIHELGHAFFCVVFGHKIVEMKLFQPNDEEGTLGYVNHSYNPRNIYHQIGNFFIGVGPILFGSAALLGLMYLLLPETFYTVSASVFNWNGTFDSIWVAFSELFKNIFAVENFSSWKFWVFLVLSCFIAIHMTLSPPDVKNSLVGTLYILLLLLVANAILYFVAYETMLVLTETLVGVGVTIACFLAIAALFASVMAIIGIVLKIVFRT
ncbi:MAG: hypothetical protein IJX88_03635 [Clostridia bacterium]|nr:hypothetical protein [Clostridia bacterium]